MSPQLRVFVSGDQTELGEERKRVIVAIDNLMQKPIAWEGLGARSETPEEWHRKEVRRCDVYVGIFGLRYSKASSREFLLASGKSRLVFVRALLPTESRDKQLQNFIDTDVKGRVTYEPFSTPIGLQTKVELSLGTLIPHEFSVPVKHRSGLSLLDQTLIEAMDTKNVAFSRELQVSFEGQFSHWAVYNSLKKLTDRGLVNDAYVSGIRWYYSRGAKWANVMESAQEKADMVNIYAHHDNRYWSNGVQYDDYSEFLVEQALVRNGFAVEGRNTRRFKGREAIVRQQGRAGRPPDLDLIVSLRKRQSIGVQVKNRLDYPEAGDIRDFLSICEQLEVLPLLVVRMAPEKVIGQVTGSGGRVIVFKRWLLRPPFPRSMFQKMILLGFPVSVYQRVPDFLLARGREVARWLTDEGQN